jgi:predicted MFS family arabinose efflux permease
MALANVAISVGNYWQGVVAERVNYQTVLYVDAALVVLALCVIPFLKNREDKKPTIVVPNRVAVAGAGLKD